MMFFRIKGHVYSGNTNKTSYQFPSQAIAICPDVFFLKPPKSPQKPNPPKNPNPVINPIIAGGRTQFDKLTDHSSPLQNRPA
ncbi:hypothetical protein [Microcystis aeruginosa]|uniref:hypothetical protein n=1 Tax=Microcystis TaxID=1125 RepID=UPI00232B7DA5|nr:hypothetical protein [Microcystis aeruginosa]MDB9507772.1 hypothetical protein [Microcystis aeruginosa CS-338/01]